MGRCVKIVEITGGTTTSTKQFVWCGNERCEVRDGAGALVNQYFARGQVNISGGIGTSYFCTPDHLGSVREMTDSSANAVGQLMYDPYGRASQLQGSTAPDFQYAAYYLHQRSGLNLTRTRAYSATLGRFINRDPIEEDGGINLFSHVDNRPTEFTDRSGLFCVVMCVPPKKKCNGGSKPPVGTDDGNSDRSSTGPTGGELTPLPPIAAMPPFGAPTEIQMRGLYERGRRYVPVDPSNPLRQPFEWQWRGPAYGVPPVYHSPELPPEPLPQFDPYNPNHVGPWYWENRYELKDFFPGEYANPQYGGAVPTF